MGDLPVRDKSNENTDFQNHLRFICSVTEEEVVNLNNDFIEEVITVERLQSRLVLIIIEDQVKAGNLFNTVLRAPYSVLLVRKKGNVTVET